MLRFEEMPAEQLAIFVRTLPLVIVVEMLFFLIGGVYRGLWRHVGFDDLIVIARCVLAGTALTAGIVLILIYRFQGPLRAVFILNALLLFVFVSAARLSFRLMRTLLGRSQASHPDARPVFIYGAGYDGELLIRLILTNTEHRCMPCAARE